MRQFWLHFWLDYLVHDRGSINDIKPGNMVIIGKESDLKIGIIDWEMSFKGAVFGGTPSYSDGRLLNSLSDNKLSSPDDLLRIGKVKDSYAQLISFLEVYHSKGLVNKNFRTNEKNGFRFGVETNSRLAMELALAKFIKKEKVDAAISLLDNPLKFAQSEYKDIKLSEMLLES